MRAPWHVSLCQEELSIGSSAQRRIKISRINYAAMADSRRV